MEMGNCQLLSPSQTNKQFCKSTAHPTPTCAFALHSCGCFIQVSSAVSTPRWLSESDNSGSLEESRNLWFGPEHLMFCNKQDPSQLMSVVSVWEQDWGSQGQIFKWIYGPRTLNKICCTQEHSKRWFCIYWELSEYRERGFQDLLVVQTLIFIGPMNTSVTNSYHSQAKLFDFNS